MWKTSILTWCTSQHMNKITNLWKFGHNWSSKLQENNERKNILVAQYWCIQMPKKRLQAWSLLLFDLFLKRDAWFRDLKSYSEVSKSNLWKIISFSKTTVLQREPFLTMFFTNQQLSIACYQVGFNANNTLSTYQ